MSIGDEIKADLDQVAAALADECLNEPRPLEAGIDQWIVITGNPMVGFTFVGTFQSVQDACDYGEGIGDFWWVSELRKP